MEISRDDDVTGNAPGELINAVQGENIVVAVNAVPGGNDVGVPSVVSLVNANVNVNNVLTTSSVSQQDTR